MKDLLSPHSERIKTNNPIFIDERGTLLPVEHSRLPFTPQRTFVVSNVPVNHWRGGHAHHNCVQYAYVVSGNVTFVLFDGKLTETSILSPGDSILIPAKIWDTQQFLTPDSVLLVFCSIPYDKSDYIFDRDEFIKLKNNGTIK